ncbi:MAG: hypothetical protein KDA89_03170 [Planctomycetaceae bacterium]|nr:hypothetical protein [Planctomycetaceae bacterium]MCA9047700.1 hypothetical protein [Planctomycetaceae bacterium]
MPLTVKEKEHWKERIEKKIDKAIEKVYRDEGKNLRQATRQKAEERVLKRLGLEKYMEQYEKLKNQRAELDQQQSKLSEEAAKPFEAAKDKSRYYSHHGHSLIVDVIKKEVTEAEKEILHESEVGRKILRLEREREELTDTIWLATSPVQIRSLWADFTTMVTDEPTELQKQAMSYDPVENE